MNNHFALPTKDDGFRCSRCHKLLRNELIEELLAKKLVKLEAVCACDPNRTYNAERGAIRHRSGAQFLEE